MIAHVNTVDDFPCIGEDNDPEQMSHLVAELEANARLIAAAPELLEAAWRAIELINRPRNEGVFEARAILAAAIAKAEGGA